MAAQGCLNERGRPFNPKSIATMLSHWTSAAQACPRSPVGRSRGPRRSPKDHSHTSAVLARTLFYRAGDLSTQGHGRLLMRRLFSPRRANRETADHNSRLVASGLLALALFGVAMAGPLEDVRKAADRGNALAQAYLGAMYAKGEDCRRTTRRPSHGSARSPIRGMPMHRPAST